MENNQSNRTNAQAEKKKLEELIAACSKKKTPTKEARCAFTESWVALAKETGINADTTDLLFRGFRIAEADPLYQYAKGTDVARTYQSVLKHPKAVENKAAITFKTLLNLFAHELICPSSPKSLNWLSRRIPGYASNKNHKQWGDMPGVIRPALVNPLAQSRIDGEASIEESRARTLMSLLRTPLQAIADNPNTDKADVKAANDLLAWLKGQAHTPVEVTEPEPAVSSDDSTASASDATEAPSEQAPAAPVVAPPPAVEPEPQPKPDSEPKEKDAAKQEEKAKPASSSTKANGSRAASRKPAKNEDEPKPGKLNIDALLKLLSSHAKAGTDEDQSPEPLDLPAIRKFLVTYKKDHNNLKKNYDKSQKEKREALSEIDALKSMLAKTRRELEDERAHRSALNAKCAELQGKYEQAKGEGEKLKESLASAEDLLAMRESHEKNQAKAAEQKLLKELRFEYEDYQDALELDMDIDLGENMRDQLASVFDILKSHGFDL